MISEEEVIIFNDLKCQFRIVYVNGQFKTVHINPLNGQFIDRYGNISIYEDGFRIFFDIKHIGYTYFDRNGATHRLDGPATGSGLDACAWYIHGTKFWSEYSPGFLKAYPNAKPPNYNIPALANGKVINGIPITRESVIRAILFNREYGLYLRSLLPPG